MLLTNAWESEIHFLESVTSTNDLLLELAEQGAPEGTIVIAQEQTKGRGQFHRLWNSLKGKGLWFSLLLRLPLNDQTIPSLSYLAPVSLCDVLQKLKVNLLKVRIKEPNDLLINEKKVAGVLVETRTGPSPFAVIGIGINLFHTEKDFSLELREKATSLALASGTAINYELFTVTLIQSLYKRYKQLQQEPEKLQAAWENNIRTGQKI